MKIQEDVLLLQLIREEENKIRREEQEKAFLEQEYKQKYPERIAAKTDHYLNTFKNELVFTVHFLFLYIF